MASATNGLAQLTNIRNGAGDEEEDGGGQRVHVSLGSVQRGRVVGQVRNSLGKEGPSSFRFHP